MINFKQLVLISIAISSFISSYSYAGNKLRGQELVKQKNCASCHGQDFDTPISPDYPKLAGQKQDYLYNSLLSYKAKDPNFARSNPIMSSQIQGLSNKDMADIAAYLASLKSSLVMKR